MEIIHSKKKMRQHARKGKKVNIGPYYGIIPETWNDLPRPLLLEVMAALIGAGYEKGLLPAEVLPYQRIVVLCVLMRMPVEYLEEWKKDRIEGADDPEEGELQYYEELMQVLDQVEFCFDRIEDGQYDELGERYQLKMGLTKNPYPMIDGGRTNKGGKLRYRGPGDAFENLTIHEMAYVFTAYDAYAESKKPKDLDYLLALLWRPGKPATSENQKSGYNGDRRRPLLHEEHMAKQRMVHIRKLPAIVKQTLWFYISSCRMAIVNNPTWSILFEPLPGQSGQSKEDSFGWAGTLLHLSGDDISKTDLVAAQPYATAFLQLAREKERHIQALAKT